MVIFRSSPNKVAASPRSKRYMALPISSAIFNGGVGLAYVGLGFWTIQKKLRSDQSLIPLHWWLVLLFHGFTWLLLGVTVSHQWQQSSHITTVKICSVISFFFAGFLYISYLLGSYWGQSSIKTVTTTRSDAFYAPLLDEETDTDSEVDTDDSVTPFVKAGFFSRMSFWWLNPLLTKGKGKILEDKDIPKLRKVDRAETCSCNKVGPLLLKAFIRVAQGKETFKYEGYTLTTAIHCKMLRVTIGEAMIWTTGLQICLALMILYYSVGLATIAVVLVITLTVLGNYPMGNLQHKHLTKLLVSRDRRLKAIAEALANMKANAAFTRIVKFLEAPELQNRHIGGDTGSKPPITRVYSCRSKKAEIATKLVVMGAGPAQPNQPVLERPPNYHRNDPRDPIINVEAPTFDGRLDPKAFTYWIFEMDHFFEWPPVPLTPSRPVPTTAPLLRDGKEKGILAESLGMKSTFQCYKCQGVLRCALTQAKEDNDWRRNVIFYTYIKCGEKDCKVIIDSESCINAVSSSTVSRLGLKPSS
ncbi:multidrug resistance-associated protein 14 [Actinidia rufa]|uniref:Multidrug resistance-associated protein 14 n=1 Tax=Actinidia rufa TaxID=165716 RepID=A0A7J0D926_9ERIC|nr:multidrug resistance-associated protein 14 [Actinidia rufa]